MTVGERIKARRKELKTSAEELGSKIGKNRATIYRYENGEIENLPLSILVPIAQALDTTPSYLMGWEDEASPLEKIMLRGFDDPESFSQDYLLSKYQKYIIKDELMPLYYKISKLDKSELTIIEDIIDKFIDNKNEDL